MLNFKLFLLKIFYVEDVYQDNYQNKSEELGGYIPKNLTYLNQLRKYLKRVFQVKITDYLPPNILGMTDGKGNIWIKRLCGYLKEHVLKHEINHNLFPHADEYEIRRITQAGHPYDLSQFELVYV